MSHASTAPCAAAVAALILAPAAVAGEGAAAQLSDLLSTHCADCHNADLTEGEFDLTSLLADDGATGDGLGDEARGRAIVRMAERVGAGEMPPPEFDLLDDAGRVELNAALSEERARLTAVLRDDPGAPTMTRLTRYEYRNVFRDLSDGTVTRAGRFLPNEGGAGEGFANVGAAQTMTPPLFESYVDAARDALRHLRVFPLRPGEGEPVVWSAIPKVAVDLPVEARKEATDDLIAWYVAQQQQWGEEHRDALAARLGIVHAAYLEAAWRYARRSDRDATPADFASVPLDPDGSNDDGPAGERVSLAPAALRTWVSILRDADDESPHHDWAVAWRALVEQDDLSPAELRRRCTAIVAGGEAPPASTGDYAPPYEISFHEAKEDTLRIAREEKRWPFRIDVGDAEELFLLITDAGDGNRGEDMVWRNGRFLFADGSAKPWQEVTTVRGAGSGKPFPFGVDAQNAKTLPADAVGARGPGSLKLAVPEGAERFEVELTLDPRVKEVSVQGLVLRQKPKSARPVPNRAVFGGRARRPAAGKLTKDQERAFRKRNVSEANRTKIGLNAERNVFADWTRTPLDAIGGPWPDQDADVQEPDFPYHYTVAEVRENATPADLAELQALHDRLASLVDGRSERDAEAVARRVVADFAARAWRRPVAAAEVDALLTLYRDSRADGRSFDDGVKSALLAVFASPRFLFRSLDPAEGAGEDESTRRPLSGKALASRLAFFLWGSVPDEGLRALAATGRLSDPETLRAQTRRMLADPRAESLTTDFAGQLWGFETFAEFDGPNAERFPEFTPALRADMLAEVEALLSDVFRHDRPLTDLLATDETYVTPALAELYGLPRPPSDARRSDGLTPVPLPPGRGGLATTGLFLTQTSLPLRTSPVQRGVWTLEALLGRRLPNPPADVEDLSEDAVNEAGETIVQQLARHRADAGCAACHDRIDPLGLSLEEFDAIGRPRSAPSDVGDAVVTTDGETLGRAADLQRYLLNHREEFLRHVARKLLGYALGRATHLGDEALLDRMVRRSAAAGDRFAPMAEELVVSPQFTTVRIEDE